MAEDEEETKVIYLTQEAYDAMKKELEWREGPNREDIIEKISAARAEGDLSENGGYHAARDAQAKNEGRINELIVKLRNAQILTPPPQDEVGIGSLVTVDMNGTKNDFLVGSRELGIATDCQIVSPESPIGSALMGHHVNEEVEYQAPNGKKIKLTIVASKPLEN